MTETPQPTGAAIHRLLDEAFDGVELSPEVQDLKEEIRANLVARVADLEAAGQAPGDAARRAMAELGDLHEVLDLPSTVAQSTAGRAGPSWEAAALHHRVRPTPGFVVGVVIAGLATGIALAVAVLGATEVLDLHAGPLLGLLGVAATGIAWVVGLSLGRETTTNHPMPQQRVAGYFLASLLGAYGLGIAGLVALDAVPVWTIVLGGVGVVAAAILFAFLLASQTNRQKAWVRAAQRDHAAVGNRFTEEPEVAARFGIYTMVIWVVAFGAFVAVGVTVGWLWALLALVAGFAAMMLLLARMLFR